MRSRRLGLGLMALAFFAIWGLGYWGFALAPDSADPRVLVEGVWNRLYASLQLFVLQFTPPPDARLPWQLESARFLAPLLVYSSIVAAVWWLARDRIRLLRARRLRGHAIVCGIGDKGIRVVRALRRSGYRVVAIDTAERHPEEESVRELGALYVRGDARDPATLRRASASRAKFLAALCPEDDTNAEIALQARALLGDGGAAASGARRSGWRARPARRHEPLRCVAHVTSPQLCRIMKEHELAQEWGAGFRLEFFNVYASAARMVVAEHPPAPPDPRPPGSDGTWGDGAPHVLVVGAGPLGQGVMAAAARRWGRSAGPGAAPMRFCVYDEDVQRKFAAVCDSFPQLAACANATLRELDPDLPAFRPEHLGSGGGDPAVAYICLEDDSRGLGAALALHRASRADPFPIVACMMEDDGVAALLESSTGSPERSGPWTFRDLHGFAVLDETCTADVVLGWLARRIHEAWLEKALVRGEAPGSRATLVPWEELDERVKEDNRRQADHIVEKLAKIGCAIVPEEDWKAPLFRFDEAEVRTLAIMEHERWMRAREREGWRRGPRDDRRRTHPDLVPWDELDEAAKRKDRDAVQNIPVLLSSLGLTIHRPSTGDETAR